MIAKLWSNPESSGLKPPLLPEREKRTRAGGASAESFRAEMGRSENCGWTFQLGLHAGFDFDDIMGRRLFLAGGTHANVAGVLAERGEIGGPEVAHAAAQTADEVGEHVVDRAANLLEGFDALSGGFAGRVFFSVTIAGRGAVFHGGE